MTLRRHQVVRAGMRFQVWDWGPVDGPVLFCLHGHFGRANQYELLVPTLPAWRIVAMDQRGHGLSDHGASYERSDYVADALAVLDALGLDRVVALGSSLGGVNAYQLAAWHPRRVRALVIEDIGAECRDDLSWCLRWPNRWPTVRAALADLHPYFAEQLVEEADGWRLRCHLHGMVESTLRLNGNWWKDWLASTCPALLLHGAESTVLQAELAQRMVARRPSARLVTVPGCGHNINEGAPAAFREAVRAFLAGLPPP